MVKKLYTQKSCYSKAGLPMHFDILCVILSLKCLLTFVQFSRHFICFICFVFICLLFTVHRFLVIFTIVTKLVKRVHYGHYKNILKLSLVFSKWESLNCSVNTYLKTRLFYKSCVRQKLVKQLFLSNDASYEKLC